MCGGEAAGPPARWRLEHAGGAAAVALRARSCRCRLFRQPRVPEVQARSGAEFSAELAPRHVERVVVAEFHLADVLVVDCLDALDERLALLHVALLPHLGEQALLLLVTPPPLERAPERNVQRGA